MKKLLILALVLTLMLTFLVSCEALDSLMEKIDGTDNSSTNENNNDVDNTNKDGGNENNGNTEAHTHSITKVDRVEADCTKAGNIEYYICSVCEKKYTDASATAEITDIVIQKNDNHSGGIEVRDTKEPTEEEEGYTGDTYCLGCGEKIKDGTSINALNHVHAMSKVEASEKTCTENGNIEYYTCSKCGKYYTDEAGTLEITLADTVIAAAHKFTYTEANDATCKEDGNVAYYTCSSCSEKFSDAGATNKITDVVIPKNDNHVGGTEIRDVKEATEEEEGYTGDTYCLGCGEKIADGESVDKLPHTHSMTKTEKSDATCIEDGNIEYYTCSKCDKLYLDENGANEITLADTVTKADHNFENNKCTVCGEDRVSEGLEFTLNSDEASYSVTGIGTCKDNDIVIPSTYNNLPVTSIGYGAFENCTSLTSVTIPDNVTSIGNLAFRNCTSLTNVTIPDSVTSIGYEAFRNCTSLTSVTIPDNVTSIGMETFYGCTSLTSITIPNSVTSIKSSAFYGCSKLEEVHISDIGAWCNISFSNYYTNPLHYANNLYLNGELVTELVIPDTVKEIKDYAFYYYTSLTNVTIPDSVTSIGYEAFYNCRNLTSVTIGNGVTSIGYEAFRNCTSLTNVTIPDSVTSIGNYAFYGCSSLTSITIGNGVTHIYSAAFYNCYGLTNIIIPNSVKSIGDSAFSCCTGLTSIIIPNSVTSIAKSTFYSCKSLTSITIPDSVTSISEHAFQECSSLTNVTIPDSVTSIGNYAFNSCDSLTSITIGNSVTYIDEHAFSNCTSLTSVTIGNSVTYIGSYAFDDCTALTEIYFNAAAMNDLSFNNDVFSDAGQSGAGIKVTIGKNVTKIPAYLFYPYNNSNYYTPKITSVEFEEGSVCKSIGNFSFCNCTNLTSITIPDSVISIGNSAFDGCDSLASVTIGNGVTYIGSYAFRGCDGLTIVTIPGSVISIGDIAFGGCLKLVEVYNLSNLTIIAGSDDNGCVGLYAISVYNSLDIPSKQWKTEDGYLFYEDGDTCYLLGYTGDKTEITLPESCNGKNYEIYSFAFCFDDKIINVRIPNIVAFIGSYAFYSCTGLTSVYYTGTAEEWSEISIGSDNDSLGNATVYYYSQEEPTKEGNFWHYDEDGNVTVW